MRATNRIAEPNAPNAGPRVGREQGVYVSYPLLGFRPMATREMNRLLARKAGAGASCPIGDGDRP